MKEKPKREELEAEEVVEAKDETELADLELSEVETKGVKGGAAAKCLTAPPPWGQP